MDWPEGPVGAHGIEAFLGARPNKTCLFFRGKALRHARPDADYVPSVCTGHPCVLSAVADNEYVGSLPPQFFHGSVILCRLVLPVNRDEVIRIISNPTCFGIQEKFVG